MPLRSATFRLGRLQSVPVTLVLDMHSVWNLVCLVRTVVQVPTVFGTRRGPLLCTVRSRCVLGDATDTAGPSLGD